MNSLTHIWSIICGSANVDQATNNVSLFNVLEQLNIDPKAFVVAENNPKIPVVNINFELFTLWKKNKKGLAVSALEKIDFIDPKGVVLGTIKSPLELSKDKDRFRLRVLIEGLKVTTPGEYKFKISVKDKSAVTYEVVAQIPLEVKAIN